MITGGWPTLSGVEASDFAYFGALAGYLGRMRPNAESALQTLAEDVQRPGGVSWEGAAGDAAAGRAAADLVHARESLTMRIVANVNEGRSDVPGGGQKGVITMYPLEGGSGVLLLGKDWTWTPPWVNKNVPIN